MTRFESTHNRIEGWFRHALLAVEPRASVHRSLAWDGESLIVGGRQVPLAADSRLIVIAVGKAAPAMARGARDVFGKRIDCGIVLTKAGNPDLDVSGFRVFEASHPAPDERGIAATTEIVDAVSGLSSEDVVLALISGGGSALMEMPRDGLNLEDVQETTKTLMHAGAGIHDLNAVRQALSQVKGGGLRQFIGPATCVSLLLSDVLGNDPHVIASGPTVPLPAATSSPAGVIQRFRVGDELSAAVRDAISNAESKERVVDGRDIVEIVADNATLVRELERIIRDDGLRADVAVRGFDGDARDLGKRLVEATESASDDVDILLGGGEATVEVTGDGKGGRNTEAALVAAIEKSPGGDWVIASLASDGDDGMADAAGAIADPGTVECGRMLGFDALAYLEDNDSATFFRSVGGLVETGPTGTNVNDVYIAVRVSGGDQEQE